ncbi:Glycerophosphodiester phosphodiesterase [Emticicia aquatica]|uniref:Glycerophosphodiester phosphodiesterase n=1 Tax=Emticicia aquatica TaxID=1681835 RepID=A0ABM9ASY0_9BACT|nr:glycerophosphodiester phosphodiesterase family protein [Emticicia aquatica]CAH0997021.1 Glycerophosphodiester phosphodiesterase [Emticicia aquatica]
MKSLLLFLFPVLTFAQTMDFEIQGHRGCRGLMPENTIPAFKKAIDLGVKTLELDVVISKDKQIVVSHDPFFNPACTIDPNGDFITKSNMKNLYLLDYKEIKKYDVGSRGNKDFPEQQKIKVYKPLLKEVIVACEKYAKEKGISPIKYNIEIKSEEKEYGISQPKVEEFSELVYQVIIKQLSPDRVILQSFDYNVLKYWHKKIEEKTFKKITLSVLIEPIDNNDVQTNLDKLGFKPQIWSPYFVQATEKRVKQLHELGIKVIPWTVNKRVEMEKVKAAGCDGLITDYPDRAKGL